MAEIIELAIIFLLLLGMSASGLFGRINLLAKRGGFFEEDHFSWPPLYHAISLLGWAIGIIALVVSFFILQWWWPLLTFVIGYWIVPIVVCRVNFALFYHIRHAFDLISAFCSIGICALFLIYYYN